MSDSFFPTFEDDQSRGELSFEYEKNGDRFEQLWRSLSIDARSRYCQVIFEGCGRTLPSPYDSLWKHKSLWPDINLTILAQGPEALIEMFRYRTSTTLHQQRQHGAAGFESDYDIIQGLPGFDDLLSHCQGLSDNVGDALGEQAGPSALDFYKALPDQFPDGARPTRAMLVNAMSVVRQYTLSISMGALLHLVCDTKGDCHLLQPPSTLPKSKHQQQLARAFPDVPILNTNVSFNEWISELVKMAQDPNQLPFCFAMVAQLAISSRGHWDSLRSDPSELCTVAGEYMRSKAGEMPREAARAQRGAVGDNWSAGALEVIHSQPRQRSSKGDAQKLSNSVASGTCKLV
jgi:hypothetical protein